MVEDGDVHLTPPPISSLIAHHHSQSGVVGQQMFDLICDVKSI